MIRADVRARLDRHDAQLALRLLAGGDGDAYAHWERVLADAGFDAILDDPALAAALRTRPAGAHASLPLFCYVVVRHALRAAGEGDRRLADYLASLVLHFGLRDRARRVAAGDDEVYETLADLLAAAEAEGRAGDPRRALLVRAHLGNYALWLSGLFPDHVEARRWRRGGPDLDYYEAMGCRGFRHGGRPPAGGGVRHGVAVRGGGGAVRGAPRGAQRGERHAPLSAPPHARAAHAPGARRGALAARRLTNRTPRRRTRRRPCLRRAAG
jgi:hypothetical protein